MNITSTNKKTFLNIILVFDFLILIIDILTYKIISRLLGSIIDYYRQTKNTTNREILSLFKVEKFLIFYQNI